ncbi:ferric uptake regulation protein [Leptolyngbya sp. Heron Island J]|uniref:Fur family transcriptional regulator n=1 Tax=Leptolyngbya sp. Heron Island J TaxID=1385935 RepID=UPI0003B97C88|nr:Fur family transcriptional regulator [Leptolyngbya sp. Heron Island J]ESA37707.1 ferric uptake regulation protein [Leptolyngbya sp. Heron Island J]
MTQAHCTPAQTAILQILRQQHQPISAQALYALMQKHQPIGLATVYRALDALKRLGWVQHRVTLAGETLYNAVEQDHHYMTCLHCGQSFPLDACPLKGLEFPLQHSGSFTIYYHTLEFFGLCKPCAIQGA